MGFSYPRLALTLIALIIFPAVIGAQRRTPLAIDVHADEAKSAGDTTTERETRTTVDAVVLLNKVDNTNGGVIDVTENKSDGMKYEKGDYSIQVTKDQNNDNVNKEDNETTLVSEKIDSDNKEDVDVKIFKENTEDEYNKNNEVFRMEVSEEPVDGAKHPCYRKCERGKTMECHYKFEVEWYQSMSKACYDCPYNATDCDRLDCIPGDGVGRPLTVINRKMPGPSVEVCLGDTVVVDVVNSLMSEGTTVHWHGHHQRDTPYMDGVPLVTQCPIQVGSSFRYTLKAAHGGTHFWHSHTGMQRADGAFGAFVVREPEDRHGALYDYDRSDHVMIILDWTHELGVSVFTDHHHANGTNKPPSLLVNGRGRFQEFSGTRYFYMPAARFNVEQGYRYRFRVINAEFLNCPIELSIDNHTMLIISSDGNDFEPIEAVSLVTYAGERFDFIVNASQEIENYWIRFRGLMDCDERFTKARQVAVLHYEGALEQEPPGDPSWEESHRTGLQVNALNKGTDELDTIAIPELTSLDADDESLREKPDFQYYIAYDFYTKNNYHFHKYPYYGFNQVKKSSQLLTPQLNHISMKMQSYPLLPGRARSTAETFCNETTVSGCVEDYCECTHVVNIPLKSVVEIILVDEGFAYDANHPFHLHGYAFRVVAMQRVSTNITVKEVKQLDAEGKIHRKLKGAPLKDTVTVPDGGYTIIRWYADNPGYWLFHCHIEFHVEIGMALVFKVGEHSDMKPVPPGFPQCGDYAPPASTAPDDESSYISIRHWWPLVSDNGASASSRTFIPSFVVLFLLSMIIL